MVRKFYMKRAILFLILFICILCSGILCNASMLIIKTEGIAAYDYVIKGINQECQDKAVIIDIKKDLSNAEEIKNRIKDIKRKVVIIIGDEAAEFASINLKGENILYSMILEPEKYNFNKKNTLGIDILINIDQLLTYLRALRNDINKIGVIYSVEENEKMIKYMGNIALKRQVQLILRAISSEQEVVGIVNDLLPQVEAIVMMPSIITTKAEVSQYISQEALKRGIPMIGLAEVFFQYGALFTVSINPIIVGAVLGQSACLVIKGNEISNLRIAKPSYSVISINLKIAEILNLKFPKKLIALAYKTIK